MLVDAGATEREKPRMTDARPDETRTPGERISRYTKQMHQLRTIGSLSLMVHAIATDFLYIIEFQNIIQTYYQIL